MHRKRAFQLTVMLMILIGLIWLEGGRWEPLRLLIAGIGLTEAIFVGWVIKLFDDYLTRRETKPGSVTAFKILFSIGLLGFVALGHTLVRTLIDGRLQHLTNWTILVPGFIVLTTMFGTLDAWALEREKRSEENQRQ